MKATAAILISCFALLLSTYAFAGCGSCGSDDDNGGCGSSDSSTAACNCADLGCSDRYNNDCLSRSECCEAFGNIGAR